MSDKARHCPDCNCPIDDPYHLKRVVEEQAERINALVRENMELRARARAAELRLRGERRANEEA